jgi:hypothetical protein
MLPLENLSCSCKVCFVTAMATRAAGDLESFGDDFLTCSVCLNQYNEPKSLPCLHTFCQECIEKHACAEKARQKAKDITAISCPLCKVVTPWNGAESLKTNFFVQSLLDSFGVKKEVSVPCGQCDEGKIATGRCEDCDGDFLCEDCVGAHRRTKLTKEHKIVPLKSSAVPTKNSGVQSQASSKSVAASSALAEEVRTRLETSKKMLDDDSSTVSCEAPTQELCRVHKNQVISTVCMECKVLLCVMCLQDLLAKDRQRHASHQIISIAESKEEIKKQIFDINEGIKAAVEDYSEQVDEAKEYEEQIKEKSKATINTMKDYNNRVCQLVRKLGGELEKEIAKYEKDELAKINARKKHMETTVEKMKELIVQTSQPVDDSRGIAAMFEQLNMCSRLKGQADNLAVSKKGLAEKNVDIVFVPGLDLDQGKEAENARVVLPLVGRVKREERESAAQSRRNDSLSSIPEAVLAAAISAEVTVTHKIQGAMVSALTLGHNKEYVAIDSKKGDVMVFSEQFKLLTRIKCRDPLDVDILADGNVAVTEGKKGHCVSVFSLAGQLLASEIAANELNKATAIAVCNAEQSIVVSDVETAKVHIIKLVSGKTEVLLYKVGPKNQFVTPSFVACSVDGTRLAVSDIGAHCVKVFRVKNGQFLYRYGHFGRGQKQLNKPESVCFDKEGRLFICDPGNARIHVVSPDNKLIGHILPKHLKKFEPFPNLIAMHRDGQHLVLANKEGWVKVVRYTVM